MTVFLWSTTAANNDDCDATVNWREGQSPASVNNSARAMMAAVKKWFDDLSGNLVTAGSSTAYTLTTNQVFTALTDGIYVRCRLDETSGAAPTLNVDSLGAKPIQSVSGTAPASGVLLGGAIYTFTYDSSADAWIVEGAPSVVEPTGTIRAYVGTTAPSGYVRANGRTIGNASSGASERANADTAALYSLLWDSYSDTVCPVSSGRGANAAADYAANKTIGLPDLRGRALFGLDDMGNSSASRLTGTAFSGITGTTNGSSGGFDTITIAEVNLPPHTHSFSATTGAAGGHQHFVAANESGSDADDNVTASDTIRRATSDSTRTQNYTLTGTGTGATVGLTSVVADHTHSVSGTSGSTGGGGTLNGMPPAFVTTWLIKL
jgi:microcystin-dependent protein